MSSPGNPGSSSNEGEMKRFDVVVLTASNESQKVAFEEQLESMKELLPSYCQYVVVADPPGQKIGNGGSTLEVVYCLNRMFGDKLKAYRVLLIHAGGFSQRLPHVSVLGKAFGLVPIGDRVMTCMEFCMESFSSFPDRMIPGIFLCCADVLLDFKCSGDWAFDKAGFTALAHPSPTEIGTTHGVFCLANPKEALAAYQNKDVDVRMEPCRRFLHKPTVAVMRDQGAVLEGTDTVLTDSVFFFDYTTAMLLNKWYEEHRPLMDEIDAYGDFLQALGPESSDEYCSNTRNVSYQTEGLVQVRKAIYGLLSETDLHTLLMYKSTFYHIGTTKEYIHHFTNDPVLRRDLHLRSAVEVATATTTTSDGEPNPSKRAPISYPFTNQCLMACLFDDFASCQLGSHLVLEYCHLGKNVTFGQNSIVCRAHCRDNLVIAPNSFLHTVDVTTATGSHGYVTFALNITDSTKAKVSSDNLGCLQYNGVELAKAKEYLQRAGDHLTFFAEDESTFSLWTIRLFPAFADIQASLAYGVGMLDAVSKAKTTGLMDAASKDSLILGQDMTPVYFSMKDILAGKDTKSMLQWRKDLREKIAACEIVCDTS